METVEYIVMTATTLDTCSYIYLTHKTTTTHVYSIEIFYIAIIIKDISYIYQQCYCYHNNVLEQDYYIYLMNC